MTDPQGDEREAEAAARAKWEGVEAAHDASLPPVPVAPEEDPHPPLAPGERQVCTCDPPGPIRLNRTNRRYPGVCRRCGSKLSIGELFGVVFSENRLLRERIEALEPGNR